MLLCCIEEGEDILRRAGEEMQGVETKGRSFYVDKDEEYVN